MDQLPSSLTGLKVNRRNWFKATTLDDHWCFLLIVFTLTKHFTFLRCHLNLSGDDQMFVIGCPHQLIAVRLPHFFYVAPWLTPLPPFALLLSLFLSPVFRRWLSRRLERGVGRRPLSCEVRPSRTARQTDVIFDLPTTSMTQHEVCLFLPNLQKITAETVFYRHLSALAASYLIPQNQNEPVETRLHGFDISLSSPWNSHYLSLVKSDQSDRCDTCARQVWGAPSPSAILATPPGVLHLRWEVASQLWPWRQQEVQKGLVSTAYLCVNWKD